MPRLSQLSQRQEDKEQWGLLEKSFSGTAGQKGPDHHLEATNGSGARGSPLMLGLGEYEADLKIRLCMYRGAGPRHAWPR